MSDAFSSGGPTKLGDLLVRHGYLTEDALRSALDHQKKSGKGKLLGEILVELAACSDDQIAECIAVEYDVPFAKLELRLCDQKTAELLPREFIENNLVMPLFSVRGVLTLYYELCFQGGACVRELSETPPWGNRVLNDVLADPLSSTPVYSAAPARSAGQ